MYNITSFPIVRESFYKPCRLTLFTKVQMLAFDIFSDESIAHGDCPAEEPRSVTVKKPSSNTLLGMNVIGGNATGIFISEIEKEGLAASQGSFRIGDRIIQVNVAFKIFTLYSVCFDRYFTR